MFTCTLDAKSRVTLTDQLYGALREEIEQGRHTADWQAKDTAKADREAACMSPANCRRRGMLRRCSRFL